MKISVYMMQQKARLHGRNGDHTFPSAPGEPCVRITAQTETPGIIFLIIMRARASIAGTSDGVGGISDDRQLLCFALALWNGQDPILKERLFGITGSEGNRGEDVKEYYFYLDSTPTHSYMKMLYKYPQGTFPYADLIETNRQRGKQGFEYELFDTGIFNENRYFDMMVEYAKTDADDILIRITSTTIFMICKSCIYLLT